MKVRRLVGLLQSESDSDKTEIAISAGYADFEILSVYLGDDGKLWIDIQEKSDETDSET